MPVAIQLHAKKSTGNPVWTPKDQPNDWLLAKMFFNNANGQVFSYFVLWTKKFHFFFSLGATSDGTFASLSHNK